MREITKGEMDKLKSLMGEEITIFYTHYGHSQLRKDVLEDVRDDCIVTKGAVFLFPRGFNPSAEPSLITKIVHGRDVILQF